MMNRTTPPRASRSADPAWEAIRYILLTVAVGVIAATVFTAFTPASLLPTDAANRIAAAAATRAARLSPTAVPVAATATPRLPRLGIVAGHKGSNNDPGAVCPNGVTEAQVNEDIAARVKVGLEASGFAVDLLNEFDVRLNQYSARALVSIHADSCAYINEEATGFKVAGAKNTSLPDESARLAACLIDRYARATGLGYHEGSITPDMTFYHGFDELAATPAAIIETGFLNLDYEFLTKRPEVAAQGIIDGIICYVRNEPVPAQP